MRTVYTCNKVLEQHMWQEQLYLTRAETKNMMKVLLPVIE